MNKHNYSVFFDVENSVFNFNSKHSFLEYFLLETLPVEKYAKECFNNYVEKHQKKHLQGVKENILNKRFFKNFSGVPVKFLSELSYLWYEKYKLELSSEFFNHKTLCEIEMHKRNNAQVVLLSSSFLPCLEPLMKEFSIDVAICAQLEVINGTYSGDIIADPLSLMGKTKAIERFLLRQDQRLSTEKILPADGENFGEISYEFKDEMMNPTPSELFRNMYRN